MTFRIKSRRAINTMVFSPVMTCLRRFNFPMGKRFSLTEVGFPSDGNSTPTDWRKYDQPGQLAIKGTIGSGKRNPLPGQTLIRR